MATWRRYEPSFAVRVVVWPLSFALAFVYILAIRGLYRAAMAIFPDSLVWATTIVVATNTNAPLPAQLIELATRSSPSSNCRDDRPADGPVPVPATLLLRGGACIKDYRGMASSFSGSGR